jgi:hypothetical protein
MYWRSSTGLLDRSGFDTLHSTWPEASQQRLAPVTCNQVIAGGEIWMYRLEYFVLRVELCVWLSFKAFDIHPVTWLAAAGRIN